MRLLSLVISFCAFVVSVSADYRYTVITNMQNGLNVTLNVTRNSIEFGPNSYCRYWKSYPVTNGIKDWIYWGITSYRGGVYLRFPEYRTGAIAQPSQTPSLFRIEKDENASYLVSTEFEPSGQRLAWAADRNDTAPNGNMILKLRPYDRSASQRFKLTEEIVVPPGC